MHILFQGDSITDAKRSREDLSNMGTGYAHLVKAYLNNREPGKYTFTNRGVGGNRVVDMYARIKADLINLRPDFLSVLIGVNDVWHELGHKNGVDAVKFEKIYTMLLEEVKEALPDTRILIMEPFVLAGPKTTGELEDGTDKYTVFRREVELRAAASRRVADRFHTEFLPLQQMFDDALKFAPAEFWLLDGVHPTEAGHQKIANAWLGAFDRK